MNFSFESNKIIRNVIVRIILSIVNISPKRCYYHKITGHGSIYIYYWERFYHGEDSDVAFRQVNVARISSHENSGMLPTNIVVKDNFMNLNLLIRARNVAQIILKND